MEGERGEPKGEQGEQGESKGEQGEQGELFSTCIGICE